MDATTTDKRTQNQMVLDYIKEFGSINPMEALRDLGCMRLGARVWDLKHEGHSIIVEDEHGTNRWGRSVRWARYKLGDGKPLTQAEMF